MSAESANPGITDVPQAVYPPLPAVTENLFVVHYAAGPRASGYAPTPPVAAIVVQHILSGERLMLAAVTEAEAAGLRPDEFLARFPQLEREMLSTFTDYATSRPDAVWVHWRMRDAIFGFDVLAQRARMHRLRLHGIPAGRRFDLSNHLARRFGDEFAPRPRLWNAARRNLGDVPGLLDDAASALAWEQGDHAAVLWSLNAKVAAIARLFERVRVGAFISGEGGPYQGAEPDAAWSDRPGNNPALIRRSRNVPTGPPIRIPREMLDPTRLTERCRAILDELLQRQAFDRASCVTTEALAKGVDGPNGKAKSFKHPVAELGRWNCVGSAVGQSGGIWLTSNGRAIAEGLKAK